MVVTQDMMLLLKDVIKQKGDLDHSNCPLCPFNNVGDDKDYRNKCQKIEMNAEYCFRNNRMDLNTFINGKSAITIENNIRVTPPEGEVCFGNTITSCLTYCIILVDNTKISVHINPTTNLSTLAYDIQAEKANELVTIFTVIDMIIKEIDRENKLIKKIIIFSEAKQYICTYSGKEFLSDNGARDLGGVVTNKNVEQWLLQQFQGRMIQNPTIVIKNREIKGGMLYMVTADGTGKIYGDGKTSDINMIESF